jgi:hypothetical protein
VLAIDAGLRGDNMTAEANGLSAGLATGAVAKTSTHGSNSALLSAASGGAPGATFEDFDTLLLAIETRLCGIVGNGAEPQDPQQTRAGVLQCVQALEQLHLTLSQLLLNHDQTAGFVAAVQAQLARAQAVMANTRAG